MNHKEYRPVQIELRIKMVKNYPVEWDKYMIEFVLNESSHCLGTEIAELAEREREHFCNICSITKGFYVKEATQEDIDDYKITEVTNESRRI